MQNATIYIYTMTVAIRNALSTLPHVETSSSQSSKVATLATEELSLRNSIHRRESPSQLIPVAGQQISVEPSASILTYHTSHNCGRWPAYPPNFGRIPSTCN
ncbi:hypothetical protein ABW19_dt0206523 [Dactylella cylindrospora]|nr:hypothetical protein ABW19_dt0206523 [Dactylella cylindrospora]